jgi:hypothetical protein
MLRYAEQVVITVSGGLVSDSCTKCNRIYINRQVAADVC